MNIELLNAWRGFFNRGVHRFIHSLFTVLFGLSCMGCEGEDHKANPAPPRRHASSPAPTVPQPKRPSPARAKIEVRDGAGQLFAFFDRRGQMRTVDGRDQVPVEARGEVMVTIPARHLAGDQVIVADLRSAQKGGGYRSWITTRAQWLDRTMPKTSRLKTDIAVVARRKPAKRRPKRRPRTRPKAAKASAPVTAATPPVTPVTPVTPARNKRVVLFTTQWCPSCRRAKAYFQRKGVAFVELDVERDPRAAQYYRAVARKHGLRGGSVPVILIGDRVFQGFSPFQVEVALNQLKARP